MITLYLALFNQQFTVAQLIAHV